MRAAATPPAVMSRTRRGSSPPLRRRPRTPCWPGVVSGSPTRRPCSTGRGFGLSTRLYPDWRPIRSSSPGPLTRRRGYWACRLRRTRSEGHLPVANSRSRTAGMGRSCRTSSGLPHPDRPDMYDRRSYRYIVLSIQIEPNVRSSFECFVTLGDNPAYAHGLIYRGTARSSSPASWAIRRLPF
jgi:hypothetical protein